MKIWSIMTLVVFVAASASAQTPSAAALPAPAAAPASGPVVTIKTAKGKTIVVNPGQKMPKLHKGDSVSVAGGQQTFVVDGVKVTADAGASFTVQAGANGLEIVSNGGAVSVNQGGTVTNLTPGQDVQITTTKAPTQIPSGQSQVQATLTTQPTLQQQKTAVSPSAPQ